MRNFQRSDSGFTVVELIIVIVLMSILSATAMSRWFDTGSYELNTARQQLISYARLGQRIALANRSLSIRLQITQLSGDWLFRILQFDGGTTSILHEHRDKGEFTMSMTAGGGTMQLSSIQSLIVDFDGMGNLNGLFVGGTSINVSGGVLLSMTGSATQEMCLSPLGFAHEGTCI